jgi:transcriptional regulator with XRE-family HTH domain
MKAGSTTKKDAPEPGQLPNPVTLELGQSLKRHRLAAGKTQLELAFEAEVERSRISKIEGGFVNPSLLTLAAICHCLGITLPVLFETVGSTLPPSWKGGALRRANQATLEKPKVAGPGSTPVSVERAPKKNERLNSSS